MTGARAPELYFDAECALCTRTAWFVDRRDRTRTLRMLSLQGPEGEALRSTQPWLLGLDSLVWVERSAQSAPRVLTHSDAVLAVGSYLGGGWRLASAIARVIPRRIRDAAYRFLARHRKKVVS
ncbi:MAG: DUF393 domain-containing protein [Gemmatimonadaceae bacterium]|nr:DUF393 domain-containing protein [Gemmatimonadaceae bacterium]